MLAYKNLFKKKHLNICLYFQTIVIKWYSMKYRK